MKPAKFLRQLFGRRRPAEPTRVEQSADSLADVSRALETRPAAELRFLVPTDRVCTHGAFACAGGWHPFVAALAEGEQSLARFYRSYRPASLAEMYFLPPAGRKGEDLPPWTLPWLPLEGNAPVPEMGLGLEHGVSYYGPASEEKLRLEMRRLNDTLASVRRSGYHPPPQDEISGWFLRRGAEWRFFVRGGKHRAAVLAHLGRDRIPVTIRIPASPVIDAATLGEAPLIRSGSIDPNLATRVFDRYFDWNGTEQHRFLDSFASA